MNDTAARDLARGTRWVAYAIGAFGLGMSNMILFLVPLRARELGASYEVIGIIVAAAAIAPALSSIPLGSIIDRLGPRRAFIMGTSACALVAVTIVTVTDYWWLVPVQFAFGISRTLGWVASQTYITTLTRASDRAVLAGRFTFFSNAGTTVGPLAAGGVSQLVGFRLAFLFVAAYAVSFAILGLFLRRTPAASLGASAGRRGVGYRTAWRLTSLPGMRVALSLTFARLWISWIWISFFPVLLVDSGLAAGVVGSVVATRGVVAMVVSPTAGSFGRALGNERAAISGLAVGVLGVLTAGLLTSFPLAYASAMMVGVASGLSLPLLLAIVSDVAPDDQRGVALGLRQTVNNVASAAAPTVAGPLVTTLGATAAFGIGGGLAGLALLGAAVLKSRMPRSQPPTQPEHAT